MTIPILIADDHGVLRAGLRALLSAEPDFEVVGEATNGYQALQLAFQLEPGVVVADVNMPGPNGIEVARELKERRSPAQVLILTMHEDPSLLREALQAGASGYILKRAVENELVDAIHAVARGDLYIDSDMRWALPSPAEATARQLEACLEDLTDEDVELLRLVARGLTSREIASTLSTDPVTVDRQRRDLQKRLGLTGRVDLMRYARQQGLIGP